MRCVIRGESTCQQGETPEISVLLTNAGDADIYLVGSLDGSGDQMRYPHCSFEVTGPDGGPRRGKMCGLMNPLRAEDFAKVQPGRTFDPFRRVDDHGFFGAPQLVPDNFREPGVYRIRFVYSAQNDDPNAWVVPRSLPAGQEVMGMLRRVPKVMVRRQEFTVTVVARGKS